MVVIALFHAGGKIILRLIYRRLFQHHGLNNTALGYVAGSGAGGVDFNQCTFIGAHSYPIVREQMLNAWIWHANAQY